MGRDLALRQRDLTTAVTPAVPGHWGHTTRVQDEVASSGSHLPWGLFSHLLSTQIRCRQPPAPKQAGEVTTEDGSRFCSLHCTTSPAATGTGLAKTTSSQWQPLPEPHTLRVLLCSHPHSTTADGCSGL